MKDLKLIKSNQLHSDTLNKALIRCLKNFDPGITLDIKRTKVSGHKKPRIQIQG